MGIRGLTGYLVRPDDNQGVSHKMTLNRVVDEWKKDNKNEEIPKIIIDGMSCVRLIYGNLEWICQGQWREYVQRVQTFVSYIKSLNVEPVFYFDGSVQSTKHDTWMYRRRNDMEKVKKIYNMLRNDKNPETERNELFIIPPTMPSITGLLLKFECDVKVHESKFEADTEIVMLARELGIKKCVGILSGDTDFMIYNTGGVPFLLLDQKGFSPSQITIFKCDQIKMAADLRISVDQLPILACLLGNDTVSYESVVRLHRALHIPRQQNYPRFYWLLMCKLCTLIKNECQSLETLECKVFGEVTETITNGVQQYSKVMEEINRDETGLEMDIIDSKIMKMLKPSNNEETRDDYLPLSMEHPKMTKLLPVVLAFRDVKRRLMGLRNRQNAVEYCVYIGGNMEEGETVHAIHSDVKITQLHDVTVTNELKWSVFCWLWSFPDSKVDLLTQLPVDLQGFTVLLHFMSINLQLEKWEIEAFVRQTSLLKSSDDQSQCSQFILPLCRGVHLSALFIRGLQDISKSLYICNFPFPIKSVMPWYLFDGKLFQSIYKQLSNGQSLPNMDSIANDIMKILYP